VAHTTDCAFNEHHYLSDSRKIVLFAFPSQQVEPFSVAHAYDGAFNEAAPELTTCNPGSMKFVTNKEAKQEVAEGKEVIFTYDVLFLVSSRLATSHLPEHCRSLRQQFEAAS